MDNRLEKKISNLVQYQFPAFYREEGSTFIDFVKAYFEWAEQEGNFLHKGRRIPENTDIDETLEDFLVYFQKKYLYGIPFDVIINKRYLLKHVLDVYRSKGSIQCYRLLFKLIYDQEIDVYLPGNDVLRLSDGTWVEPRYIEVTNVANLQALVGATIIGISSRTQAVVESYITEAINGNIIATLYITNVLPKGSDFNVGEKVIDIKHINDDNLAPIVGAAPTVLGSLDSLEILNGGQGFKTGDVIKIVEKDLANGQTISFGRNGILRVTNTGRGFGALSFNISKKGTGLISGAADTFLYKKETDTTGQGGSFTIDKISEPQDYTYNTDLICDYVDVALNASSYGFPGSPSANVGNTIATALRFTSNTFGGVLTFGTITTGNGYTASPYTFVRSVQTSNNLPGTITYNTGSNTVSGTSTQFARHFANGDVIYLQANTSNNATAEKHVIKEVTSNTSIILYGPPAINSTASALYRAAPSIIPSQFAYYEPGVIQSDGSISGLNSVITADPSSGNAVITKVKAINSGKAFIEGESVKLYLYGGVNDPTIVNAGSGYTNGDILIFSGGSPVSIATGFANTNASGNITSVTLTYYGAGYVSVPTISVRSNTGTGATLTTTLKEFNTLYEVTGLVKKAGIGRSRGFWSTTRGFLNSDKYIQDSYFYQDFSYQIRVASALDRYRDILYNTFHVAGSELFGEYLVIQTESSNAAILYEPTEYTLITSNNVGLESSGALLLEDGTSKLLME